MIQPTATTIVKEALRELKIAEQQDCQINREQANNNFSQKIAELQGQVQILKDQASKIGSMGIFNFVVNLVTTVLTAIGGFLSKIPTKAAQTAIKVIGFAKNVLTAIQSFLNTLAEKDKVESQAEIKKSEVLAETFEKFYTDYHAQEQEAKQRAHETLQTMKEINKENSTAYEAMAQIGK